MKNFFERAIAQANIPAPGRAPLIIFVRDRPLPIFVIWHKFATHAISRDSKKAAFFMHAIANANISALLGTLLL